MTEPLNPRAFDPETGLPRQAPLAQPTLGGPYRPQRFSRRRTWQAKALGLLWALAVGSLVLWAVS